MGSGVRVGGDVGGTFTDIVFLEGDGTIRARKVPSTPDDFGRAVVEGIAGYLKLDGKSPGAIESVEHGTTVATNAILERKGARVGLLTTKGFRDVLEIRRVRLPVLYDIAWRKPDPLVPRHLRLEVDERIGAHGRVVVPLDEGSARAALRSLKDRGVESVAVCFLHSYGSPEHERAVGALAREAFDFVSLSADILPEMREYERTATTVVDAYVKPVVGRYLKNLDKSLASLSVRAPLHVMQSIGGLVSAAAATAMPVGIIESGPAAGVIAAAAAGKAIGLDNLIAFDMGGTTAKTSVIEGGKIATAAEYEVGSDISQASRLIKGSGHLIRVPAINISEVGAGGGSIAWIDAGGALRVGPHSAGADPGPVCYGRGGEQPTVTDANLVLGYLNPSALVGGDLEIDAGRARDALTAAIAKPLGLDLLEAAEGIHRIANAAMQRAIRSVTIERGRDPRDFTLLAFGGSGPVHAVPLAQALDVGRVVVPPFPGLFSSIGLLLSDIERLFMRSMLFRLEDFDAMAVEAAFEELEREAKDEFAAEGFAAQRVALERSVDLRYRRQIHDLNVPFPSPPATPAGGAGLAEAFHREHEHTYGYAMYGERVELVSLKLRATGLGEGTSPISWPALAAQGRAICGGRKVYFGRQNGHLATPILDRPSIPEDPMPGPVIIEEYDSTVVVPPGWTICRSGQGFLFLDRRP